MFVRFAGADDAVVLPDGDSSPLPRFLDFGVDFVDEFADQGQSLSAPVGQVFDSTDEIGTIESVKAVAEVFTPVAGEIVEVNESLADDPELLNEDPHADGWLVKIRFSSAADLKSLMNAEQYTEFASGKE